MDHENQNGAALMVLLFLLRIPIATLSELNRYAALLLSNGADYLTVFTPELV